MTGTTANSFPNTRMRRMRRDEFSRRLMRQTHLSVDALIYPMFVVEGRGERQPVASMPGIERLSVDQLLLECETLVRLKIPAIALFPGVSQFTQPIGDIAAAAVVVTVPVMLLVILFQRRIVAGLTAGAVKG